MLTDEIKTKINQANDLLLDPEIPNRNKMSIVGYVVMLRAVLDFPEKYRDQYIQNYFEGVNKAVKEMLF